MELNSQLHILPGLVFSKDLTSNGLELYVHFSGYFYFIIL